MLLCCYPPSWSLCFPSYLQIFAVDVSLPLLPWHVAATQVGNDFATYKGPKEGIHSIAGIGVMVDLRTIEQQRRR
jgi:hypothetical protein